MAINPSDTSFALVAETVPGTTNATPTFLSLNYIAGDEPNYQSDVVESQLVRANRSGGATRKTNFRVEGSLKTALRRDGAVDALLESGLSGAFTANVAKGGLTDKSLTIEKLMKDGASSFYRRFVGCQVSKLGITADSGSNAELSVEVVGMTATTGTAILTGATYTAASSTTKELTGLDAVLTIAGLTVTGFRKFDLSVEHDRQTLDRMGNAAPLAVATAGNRKVKLSVEFYRSDWSPETLCVPDVPMAVTIVIGSGTDGYTITLPAAYATLPQDSADGAKAIVKIDFSGGFDATAATNISISKP